MSEQNAIHVSDSFIKPRTGKKWYVNLQREITHEGNEYSHCQGTTVYSRKEFPIVRVQV